MRRPCPARSLFTKKLTCSASSASQLRAKALGQLEDARLSQQLRHVLRHGCGGPCARSGSEMSKRRAQAACVPDFVRRLLFQLLDT